MDYENRIIDFLSGNELKLGLVVRQQKDKMRVEDGGGHAERVTPKQVLVTHGTASAATAGPVLRELAERIAAAVEEVDTELLWESVSESPEEELSVEALAVEYFGQADPLEQAALARAVMADSVRFKRRVLSFTPRRREEAQRLEQQQQREAERAAARDRSLAWLRDALRASDQPVAVPPEMAEFLEQTREFVLQGHNTDAAKTLEEAARRVSARELAVELLERTGQLPPDADVFMLINGVSTGFSHAVQNHVDALQPYVEDPSRTDYSALPVFNIDDAGTREIDDALSVEREGTDVVVGIHIADPATFVSRDDPLDRTALGRPLSLYLPTTTVTMLPSRVGCDLASLNAGELRPTLSFRVAFDSEGHVRDWQFGRGQVRVAHSLTYDDVEAVLAGSVDHPVADALRDLAAIAEALRRAREARGAFHLSRPELKVRVSGDRITIQRIDGDSPAHRLVSEMMILANWLTAEYALSNDVPIIYRVQEPPNAPIASTDAYDPVLFNRQVRSLRRTRLSTHPQPHGGLGLDLYTQVSSPIRRYADLIIQRQLAAHFAGQAPPYATQELFEVLSAAETTEAEHRNLERAALRYWLMEHLRRERLDDLLTATLIVAKGGNSTAELDELCLRGRLNAASTCRPGDRLKVRIAEINPRRDWLTLDAVGPAE